jgi:hypothetical protein
VMEERRTAELLSDFDDYKIDDAGEMDGADGEESDKVSSRKKHKKRGH